MQIAFSEAFIDGLLVDDCPFGDITTDGLGIGAAEGRVTAKFKAEGIVAGACVAKRLFEKAGARVTLCRGDGEKLPAGDPILIAEGSARSLHRAYKTAQTAMEYASGIAFRTRIMVERARSEALDVNVALTRKHFPGTKILSYIGLFAGGGIVHRNGLSDSILVFDQHRVFAKDPIEAVKRLKRSAPEKKVAVEVGSAQEGMAYVRAGVEIIQCERFSVEALAAFVREAKSLNPTIVINAAGGVNAENAADYARAGADVLVSTWPYFGKPWDVEMTFESLTQVD